MHRRRAADLSDPGPIFAAMHAVRGGSAGFIFTQRTRASASTACSHRTRARPSSAAPGRRPRRTACIAAKMGPQTLRSAAGRRCMIFAQMAGLLAMLALLPGGVLSG